MARSAPAGWNWLFGGAAAAVAMPALAIGLGAPFWISLLAALLAGGGVTFALTPRTRLDRLDASGLSQAKIAFARDLLADADGLTRRISTAANAISDTRASQRFRHLAEAGHAILDTITEDPLKIDRARRFITYYLPRAAELAEGFVLVEKLKTPDPQRRENMNELINRLDIAFTRYADNLHDADLDRLDIEMKLLKSSLDDELGPMETRPANGTDNR